MDQVYGGGAAGGGGGYAQQAQQPVYPDQSQVGGPTQLFTPGMAGNDVQQPQQPFYPQQPQQQQPGYAGQGQAAYGAPAGGVDQMANQFQGMNVGGGARPGPGQGAPGAYGESKQLHSVLHTLFPPTPQLLNHHTISPIHHISESPSLPSPRPNHYSTNPNYPSHWSSPLTDQYGKVMETSRYLLSRTR
jgi:hypothetical protein